jgi:hypothetical protein
MKTKETAYSLYFKKKSLKSIAAILGICTVTAKNRIVRTHRGLKREIKYIHLGVYGKTMEVNQHWRLPFKKDAAPKTLVGAPTTCSQPAKSE